MTFQIETEEAEDSVIDNWLIKDLSGWMIWRKKGQVKLGLYRRIETPKTQ